MAMHLIKRHETWDPFDLMTDFQNEMNRLFHRSLHKKNGWEKTFEPEVDLVEEKDSFIVKADIPGIKKEEMDIKVEGRLLTLKGERKEEKETKEKNYYASERFYGAFTRMIELPTDVKADQVKATYKDGVLEITLPKTEGAKAKQVTVEVK
jgi:HSP20 family protein